MPTELDSDPYRRYEPLQSTLFRRICKLTSSRFHDSWLDSPSLCGKTRDNRSRKPRQPPALATRTATCWRRHALPARTASSTSSNVADVVGRAKRNPDVGRPPLLWSQSLCPKEDTSPPGISPSRPQQLHYRTTVLRRISIDCTKASKRYAESCGPGEASG